MNTVLWHPDLELDPKNPADNYLVKIDWSDKLDTDTIALADVSAESGVTVSVESSDATTQIIRIAGGDVGNFYTVTAIIDTGAPQHFERSMIVPVEAI